MPSGSFCLEEGISLSPVDPRTQRALALQARILSAAPMLPERPGDLFVQMRNALLSASHNDALATSPGEILRLLKKTTESDGKVAIVGGEKDQSRTRKKAHFSRRDGAWFHFSLTVALPRNGPLELIGYNFELCFPEGRQPVFVRFDLNPKDHHNEDEGLRSHVHPGSDDFSAPSPLMSPLEILDVLLYDLRLKRASARV
jgi:hypothetical protein